ncbi:MAG: hypothetical protein ACRDK0_15700, partial [Solirubrobacteraceae bacterium]
VQEPRHVVTHLVGGRSALANGHGGEAPRESVDPGSDRVYRSAWTPEQAFELLRGESGSAFDERCVEALAKVVGLAPAWVADVGAPGGRTTGVRAAYTRTWPAPPPA